MKKLLSLVFVLILTAAMVFALVGCNNKGDATEIQELRNQIKELTDKLSNLEQNSSSGENGADGETPHIGTNGNWWIGTTDTGIKAQGPQGTPGEDGQTPYIGTNGNWYIGTTDTGVKAQGQQGEQGIQGPQGEKGDIGTQGPQGEQGIQGPQGTPGADGQTPHIGNNGNWYIGTIDTGVKAQGAQGASGKDGNTPYIGENGNWHIGTTDTGVKAVRDEDIANIDNLIASNIYTTKKEFVLDEIIDIFCNGDKILSISIGFISPDDGSLNLRVNIYTYDYALPRDHINNLLRIEGVHVDEETGKTTHEFLNKSSSDRGDVISPHNQLLTNWPRFGGTSHIANATYFNIHIAIPGTYIPMASIKNISKSDYLNGVTN